MGACASLPPGESLRRDHARLDGLFSELLEECAAGNQRELRSTWTELEAGVVDHFDTEERFILPLFARVDPQEVTSLRADHSRIRGLLAELGVGLDLHLLRLSVARELIDSLRAHARREDRLLYRWMDRESQSAGQRSTALPPPFGRKSAVDRVLHDPTACAAQT